ncbi:Alkaline phosphatase [hydrothermal vent metagenome]|uniref:Alkaline phosphatase n=1 Tax=hydrothermal vent metagenome TaxID=652676 RepID=A0A3B0UKZ8_9ZZZZ
MADYTQQMARDALIIMNDKAFVEPTTYLSKTATEWSWNTGSGFDVTIKIKGSGFTYSGDNATAGNVTSVEFYVDATNDPTDYDFDVTSLQNVDITKLNLGAREFWNEVLQGDDSFTLTDYYGTPSGTSIQFGDDYASATSLAFLPPSTATDSGGNDYFVDGYDFRDLVGDIYTLAGSAGSGLLNNWAVYDAGDDYFRGQPSSNNYRAIGDAWTVGQYAILNGGNDTINSSATSGGGSMAVGDVYEQTGGTVNGGDDIIAGNSGYQGNISAYNAVGDVWKFSGGIMVGGNDFIQANNAGGIIAGDVNEASGTGTITGGNDTIIGSYQNDTIYGDVGFFNDSGSGLTITNGNDIIYGGAGRDIIYGDSDKNLGSGGNDRIFGQAGDDNIEGGAGDDFIDGGSGDDEIGGGDGNDTLSYASAMGGVNVDLGNTGYQNTVGAGRDRITSMENLEGSAFSDVLKGNTGNNYIYAGNGDDVIKGGSGGWDFISGDMGYDTVDYSALGAGVTANLMTGSATSGVGFYGADYLFSIENLKGTIFDDSLIGNNFANVIEGGKGNDILDGGAGIDMVSYVSSDAGVTVSLALQGSSQNTINSGVDILNNFEDIMGSDWMDKLTGNAGANTIWGGSGNDTIDGGAGTDTAAYWNPSASHELVSYGGTIGVISKPGTTDGTDRLTNIENLRFSDGIIAASSIKAFDPLQYIAGYDDLINAFGANQQAGFDHYVPQGFNEGRARDSFDGLQYIAGYDDLINAGFGVDENRAAEHYIIAGRGEGRARDSFDGLQYIAGNTDLINAGFGVDENRAAEHYIIAGRGEGRARDNFDEAAYLSSLADATVADFNNDGNVDGSEAARYYIEHYFDVV